jgi:hypothetical protein
VVADRWPEITGCYGYTDLASAEVQSKLDRIQNVDVTLPPVEHGVSVPKLAMFIIAAILLPSLTVNFFN